MLQLQQTRKKQAYDQALRAWCELSEWPEAVDFRMVAARHLARSRAPMPIAILAGLGDVTDYTSGLRLREHPALFQEWNRRLWSLQGCSAEAAS